MADKPRIPILISGAGPTGLMLACQLARYGVDFRIVDGKSGPTRESRALGVQARTLEQYQAMGVSDEAVAQGWPSSAFNIYVGTERAQRIPLSVAGAGLSPFPYLLILEQSRNEALLYKKLKSLGRDVEWQVTLERIEPVADGVTAILRHADGRGETVHVGWLAGCDGARSPVREQLKLTFTGGTYENIFYVADTRVDWSLPKGELAVCISRETFVLFFPMTGEHRYRVIGILPAHQQDENKLRFEDIEAAVRGQMDIPLQFSDTSWFSIYRVHHRCVGQFRSGRCVVAGDAAHVHSPLGGQGMNTGLQDACNLAWKLALVSQGYADDALLDSYHEERWPFAQRLLKTTDTAFRFIISQQPFLRWFRLNVFPRFARYVMGIAVMRRLVFRTVSQIIIHYRKSRLSLSGTKLKVRAGDRMPYVEISSTLTGPRQSIYAWLNAPGFHLLMMQRKPAHHDAVLDALAGDWRSRLQLSWPSWFHVHVLTAGTGADALFDALGVGERALVLVRPDQYLAFTNENFDWEVLNDYLRNTLGLVPAAKTA